jgi:transposase-like protein
MPRRRWSEQQMRELLREHERSGLSLQAFAAAAEVPYTTLAWWRSKLRRADAPRFVPVHVQDENARVEIVVGDVVVRVADDDERAVARLVRAILSC